jgi:hypothetical protein
VGGWLGGAVLRPRLFEVEFYDAGEAPPTNVPTDGNEAASETRERITPTLIVSSYVQPAECLALCRIAMRKKFPNGVSSPTRSMLTK